MATVGLRAETERELLRADRPPRLSAVHLEPLALAAVRVATLAEDGLKVLPARLVGGHDRDRGRAGHSWSQPSRYAVGCRGGTEEYATPPSIVSAWTLAS